MNISSFTLRLAFLSMLTLAFVSVIPASGGERANYGLAAITLPPWLTFPTPGHPSSPPPETCVAPPAGLISWWQGEGNALDGVGMNNGVLQGGVTFFAGEVGQAFLFNDTNAGVLVPANASLDVGGGEGFTLETWIRPTDVTQDHPLFEWNNSVGWGVHFHIAPGQPFNEPVGPGELYANIVDIYGNWHQLSSPAGVVISNVFQHVALTYEKSSGLATIYCNGRIVSQQNLGSFTPLTTYDLYLGRRPATSNDPTEIFSFAGLLDEPAVYSRALSQSEIQAIYNAGSAGKCTSGLPVRYPAPQVFNITPALATNGTLITITGTNFNSQSTSNIVRFGAVQAAIVSATPTTLMARVPAGATYAPVTVTVNGLTASSSQFFEPTFIGEGASLSSASFGSRVDLPASNNPFKTVIADLDGDGKPDLIVANVFNNTVSLYRNISTNGLLTENSFAPRVDLATSAGQYAPYGVAVADVDGDGKLDIIDIDYNNSIVSVYRNISTPGNINSNTFATRVDFACGLQPRDVEVKDMDGDGRPDIITANWGDGTVSILRNTSEPGSITVDSFAAHVDIAAGTSCDSIAAGDLDGDGKPDIAVVNTDAGTVSVLRNLASPGSLTTDSFAPQVAFAVAPSLIYLTIGDVDGDGKLDLAVTSANAQVYVLHNISQSGNLSFDAAVGFPLGGVGHIPAFADLDGDGKIDLAVVTELNSTFALFQNVGAAGTFDVNSLASRVDLATGWNAWGLAIADLDGDGRPDCVFCNQYDHTISIYQNQTPLLRDQLPVITAPPLSRTVLEGSSATFSVTATGPGTLTYQWKFNNVNILQATNITLTLTNLQSAQAGNYTVTVSNSYGGVTSAAAVLAVTTQDVLIYNYAGTEKVTTAGQEYAYNYSGEMFFLPSSTNGVFVGWATINGKKQYWVSAFSDYLLATIPGAANHTYTILGKAGNAIDSQGRPSIWSYLHKGQNTTLTVAVNKTFSFPNTFSCNDNQVYPDPQTGIMILREATSTYTYSALTTLSANLGGQTVTELANALTQTLTRQGYQPQ